MTFKEWLLDQGYQPATVAATCLALRRLSRPYGLSGLETDTPHLRRYLSYVHATKKNPLGRSFLRSVKAMGLVPVTQERAKQGRRNTPLLMPKEFEQFRVQLRKDSKVGMLTLLYAHSGLRVSKFLSLSPAEALASYPMYETWLRSRATRPGEGLYQIVSDTPRGAYRKMRTLVARTALNLGVEASLDSLSKSRLQIEVG